VLDDDMQAPVFGLSYHERADELFAGRAQLRL